MMLTLITGCAKLTGTKKRLPASSTSTDVRGDFLILAKSNITVSGAKGTVQGSNTDAGNPRRWCEMLAGTLVPSPLRVSYQRKVRLMPASKKTPKSSARDPRLAPWVDPEPKRPQTKRQQLEAKLETASIEEKALMLAALNAILEELQKNRTKTWLADTIGPHASSSNLAIYQN